MRNQQLLVTFRQYELNKCRPVSKNKEEGDKYTAEVLIFFPDYTTSYCKTYHASKRQAKASAKKNSKWVKKYGQIHKTASVETLVEEISCFI